MITGAAFGIGRATAVLFAREGARLVLTDIQGEPLLALADELRAGGTDVETVIGDVSVHDDARRMIAAATERFGRLDVLVANAGIIPMKSSESTSGGLSKRLCDFSACWQASLRSSAHPSELYVYARSE